MKHHNEIQQSDLIDSIEDALQFISYYHPVDFIHAMTRAYETEQNPQAKEAMAQILINSKMAAEGHRPLCQDTGIVTCFVKVGMDVTWDKADMSLQEMVDEGVRRAYTSSDNPLRASIVSDPVGRRLNTKDNTPAVVHVEYVKGHQVEILIAAKGGGSENKSKMVVLNPSDDIADWVVKTVSSLGAGWCPPGILGIGVGGTAEKAMVLAKASLMSAIDMPSLIAKGASNAEEALRIEIYQRVNELGIGAQGLGGLTTVLDVKLETAPCHAASKPVGLIPNCAATRHVHFTLKGEGKALFTPPSLDSWPDIVREQSHSSRKVNLDTLTKEKIKTWVSGEQLLLTGTLLTGRDAAHKKIESLLSEGKPLPKGVNFHNKLIYYVGPVDPVREEVVGPAGPTTSTRMDKFTDMMLEKVGVLGMIGKAERGEETVQSIQKHQSVYLIAVGGAAYLVSKAIKKARVLAFPELGMEAIYEFEVEDMPVTVAVDATGNNIHEAGPAKWQTIIMHQK